MYINDDTQIWSATVRKLLLSFWVCVRAQITHWSFLFRLYIYTWYYLLGIPWACAHKHKDMQEMIWHTTIKPTKEYNSTVPLSLRLLDSCLVIGEDMFDMYPQPQCWCAFSLPCGLVQSIQTLTILICHLNCCSSLWSMKPLEAFVRRWWTQIGVKVERVWSNAETTSEVSNLAPWTLKDRRGCTWKIWTKMIIILSKDLF